MVACCGTDTEHRAAFRRLGPAEGLLAFMWVWRMRLHSRPCTMPTWAPSFVVKTRARSATPAAIIYGRRTDKGTSSARPRHWLQMHVGSTSARSG